MDYAALFISLVAALGTGAAAIIAWFSRADALKAGQEAKEAAERATVAAEKMAAIQSAIFDGPPWSMTWSKGDTYLLTNDSPVAARNVTFETDPPHVNVMFAEEGPWEIGPRSAISFMWGATLSTGMKRDAVVRWQRPGSEEFLEWRHPLPNRP